MVKKRKKKDSENTTYLKEQRLKSSIPAGATELSVVISSVPTHLSNHKIYKAISTTKKVISVRRIMRNNSNQKEILICGGCLNDISDEDYISALSQDWHRDCFRCSVCDAQLTTWFFEKGGLLFCREDYWTRFGDVCHRCGQVVYGSSMAAGELRYHSECFACAACGVLLGETERYALVDRDTLYCQWRRKAWATWAIAYGLAVQGASRLKNFRELKKISSSS